jgi:hypothetical protein
MRLQRRQLFPGIVAYPIPEGIVEALLQFSPRPDGRGRRSLVLAEDRVLDYSAYLTETSADFATYSGTEILRREDLLLVHGEAGFVIQPHHDSKWFAYRTVSSVSYLNPGEYTGGTLYFPKLGEVSYAPDTPTTVFFPAGIPYSHKTASVRGGIRKTVRTFWSDLPPEEPHPRVRDLDINQEGTQDARNPRPRPI